MYDSSLAKVQENLPLPECQKPDQSPVAIYEDLNCLHLNEEAVLLQNSCAVKSSISKSLFKHVASTVYFSLKDEQGTNIYFSF